MKKFVALFVSALLLLSSLSFVAAADSDWEDLWLTHYNDGTVEGAGVIFTTTDTAGAWWHHISFKPVDAANGIYEVVEISLGEGSATAIAIPAGGFVYGVNSGNNWPDLFEQNGATGDGSTGLWYDDPDHAAMPNYNRPGAVASMELAAAWEVGDQFQFWGLDLENLTVPTSTEDLEWYDDAYVCTAKIRVYDGTVAGDPYDSATTIEETITVDGILDDNGWAADGWYEVSAADGDGVYQQDPTTDELPDYKFQVRVDDEKVYFGVEYDDDVTITPDGLEGNGNGTNIRLWIHNGKEGSTTYTHFYDIYQQAAGVKVAGYENTNPTGNSKAAIADTSIVANTTVADGKWIVEFSIDLDEVGSEFSYFFTVSNKVNENVCLFYPAIPLGAETRLESFPYNNFYLDGALKVDDSLALGTIVVGGGNDDDVVDTYEDDIKAAMGEADPDADYTVTLTGPATYESGDVIEIVATVNAAADVELISVDFDLFYDVEKLTLTNATAGDGSLDCATTLPNSNWENLTQGEGSDSGKVHVAFGNAASADGITDETALVLTFTFTVNDGAEGKLGVYVANNDAIYGNDYDFGKHIGAGDYVVVSPEDNGGNGDNGGSTDPNGDNGINVVVFAVIALVSICGTAIVIKARG